MVLELLKLRSPGVSVVSPFVSSLWDHHSFKSAKQSTSFPMNALDRMHRASWAGQLSKDSTWKDTSYFGAELRNELSKDESEIICGPVLSKIDGSRWRREKPCEINPNVLQHIPAHGNTTMGAWLYSQINLLNLYVYTFKQCVVSLHRAANIYPDCLRPWDCSPCTFWQPRRRWL